MIKQWYETKQDILDAINQASHALNSALDRDELVADLELVSLLAKARVLAAQIRSGVAGVA